MFIFLYKKKEKLIYLNLGKKSNKKSQINESALDPPQF